MKNNRLVLYTNDKSRTAAWYSDTHVICTPGGRGDFYVMATTHSVLREMYLDDPDSQTAKDICQGIRFLLKTNGDKI